MEHQPVMTAEVLAWLGVYSDGIIIDGTLGGGGHSRALLERTPDPVKIIGFDRDPDAVKFARAGLADHADRIDCYVGNYAEIAVRKSLFAGERIRGVLLDLGYSSRQMEAAGRGFSFRDEVSLDMRYNTDESTQTAADLVNTSPETTLADLIWRYGEERHSRRIAAAIVRRREKKPFTTGSELGSAIAEVVHRREAARKLHPATRTFQALRIAVNQELTHLETFLDSSLDLLAPGGRLVVISFHSLEDRIVKQFMNRASGKCQCPPGLPICCCNPRKRVKIKTRRPQTPSTEECEKNPRARSAKLRCAERIEEHE